MRKTVTLAVALIIAATFAVSGCGTAPKKVKDDITGIKTRVDTLETRVEYVEAKQEQVEKMVEEQPVATTTVEVVPAPAWPETNFTAKSGAQAPAVSSAPFKAPTVRETQAALKNAGYYSGKVDGIKGKQTDRAIKAFQRDHGLSADGIVGSRTWGALSKYASGSGDDETK